MNGVIAGARGRPLRGALRPPGDKSISHRALLLAGLARGQSRLRGLGPGADVRSTAACLAQLGVEITTAGSETLVRGRGGADAAAGPAWREPADVLDCGNAGTTMRLLLGPLAAAPGLAVLTGDSSLRRRPMRRVTAPLAAMGARIWGRAAGDQAPLAVMGAPLRAATHRIAVASAQVKSALLLAGLFAAGRTVVREPWPSRDHTELMLAAMGVAVERPDELTAAVTGPATLAPLDLAVPGDPSAAAYWVAAALLVPGSRVVLRDVSLNPRRLGLLAVLRRAGARLRAERRGAAAGEPAGDIVVEHSAMGPLAVGPGEVPALVDELPLLALLACGAEGRSEFRGAGELRAKETDRLACIAAGLRAMGAAAEELPDGLVVDGPARLRAPAAPLAAEGDHRMAMTWAIAGLCTDRPAAVDGLEAVAVSYPSFLADLAVLAGVAK